MFLGWLYILLESGQTDLIKSVLISTPFSLSLSPGVIIVPSAGVGIVLGGYIIKKLKLGARESAKLAMICSGVSLLCFSTLFIVGCESINLGGINIPYTTG